MQEDKLFSTLAEYVSKPPAFSEIARKTARYALLDAIGCGIRALSHPECVKLLGPWFPMGPQVGVPILGTTLESDPIKAAFDIGVLIRYLDYNDTWLAKEWAHPSDNLGAIISAVYYANVWQGENYTVANLLDFQIMAYEIQGCLAVGNAFNRVGLDHVILVKLASSLVCGKILKATYKELTAIASQVFVDGHPLRTYRHAPNTGSRKSWAAGDATSRGFMLANLVMRGESGYASALSAPVWGFEAVYLKGQSVVLDMPLSDYVMRNILFKVSYPAEFHAQTAVECALNLRPKISNPKTDIQSIKIYTHEAAMRIINKSGPLRNYADRDHCLQYMVAVALLYGELTEHSYHEPVASDPLVEDLRAKMELTERPDYTKDYLDPAKRAIPNRLEITLTNGKVIETEVYYPIGHEKRRIEGTPLLLEKYQTSIMQHYPKKQAEKLIDLTLHKDALLGMKVEEFLKAFSL